MYTRTLCVTLTRIETHCRTCLAACVRLRSRQFAPQTHSKQRFFFRILFFFSICGKCQCFFVLLFLSAHSCCSTEFTVCPLFRETKDGSHRLIRRSDFSHPNDFAANEIRGCNLDARSNAQDTHTQPSIMLQKQRSHKLNPFEWLALLSVVIVGHTIGQSCNHTRRVKCARLAEKCAVCLLNVCM